MRAPIAQAAPGGMSPDGFIAGPKSGMVGLEYGIVFA